MLPIDGVLTGRIGVMPKPIDEDDRGLPATRLDRP
jgi:hypothetical protein